MTEEEAKKRFMMLSLIRFVSVVLVMFGAYVFQTEMLGADSALFGGIFMVMGAVEFFFAPMILKKVWQKQQP